MTLYLLILFIQLLSLCCFVTSVSFHGRLPSFPLISNSMTTNVNSFEKQLINTKASFFGSSIWSYSGCVRNPLSGKEIAFIQGLELVTKKSNNSLISSKFHSIWPFSPSNNSYFSHKLFIYTPLHNKSEGLTHYRIRPQSPSRKVNPIKEYSNLITLTTNSTSNSLSSVIEWPSGRALTSKKGVLKRIPLIFPLSVFMKQIEVTNFIKSDGNNASKKKKKHGIFSNSWISFSSESNSGGRSQEHYVFKQVSLFPFIPFTSSATVDYKRYGEGPPWFSPGRLCLIELKGTRHRSLKSVPKSIVSLVEQWAPEFLSKEKFDFYSQKDLLSDFRPWYYRLIKI